jgi:methylenetetrahydrofolate reductase (NADPH)
MPASFSLEATRPTPAELAGVAGIAGPGIPIFLSSVPKQTLRDLGDRAVLVRRAGLEPVPHLAARRIGSATELHDFLSRMRDEAGLRRVLVIAGDTDRSGPFPDALSVIKSGALQNAGLSEIGIAGYPDRHPKFAMEVMAKAMREKIAAARAGGLELKIYSQFCFSPDAIVNWIKCLRAEGIGAPIHVGMSGPANVATLLAYALRCGVDASLRSLMSGAAIGLIRHLGIGQVAPDAILDALAVEGAALGEVRPHYFSFGGVVETARYAHNTAARRPAKSHAMTGSN